MCKVVGSTQRLSQDKSILTWVNEGIITTATEEINANGKPNYLLLRESLDTSSRNSQRCNRIY